MRYHLRLWLGFFWNTEMSGDIFILFHIRVCIHSGWSFETLPFFPIKLPSTYWIKVIESYIPFLYAKHKWLEQKYEWYNQPIQYVHPWYKPYHRSKCFWNILWSLCIVIEYFTWNTTIPWHHLIIPNSRNTHHHYFIIILFNLLYLFFLYEKNRKMGLYF